MAGSAPQHVPSLPPHPSSHFLMDGLYSIDHEPSWKTTSQGMRGAGGKVSTGAGEEGAGGRCLGPLRHGSVLSEEESCNDLVEREEEM